MKDRTLISQEDLEWLENKIKNIVKDCGDAEEISDLNSIEELHYQCKTPQDYYEVIEFIKKNPDISRNDLIVFLWDIGEKYVK